MPNVEHTVFPQAVGNTVQKEKIATFTPQDSNSFIAKNTLVVQRRDIKSQDRKERAARKSYDRFTQDMNRIYSEVAVDNVPARAKFTFNRHNLELALIDSLTIPELMIDFLSQRVPQAFVEDTHGIESWSRRPFRQFIVDFVDEHIGEIDEFVSQETPGISSAAKMRIATQAMVILVDYGNDQQQDRATEFLYRHLDKLLMPIEPLQEENATYAYYINNLREDSSAGLNIVLGFGNEEQHIDTKVRIINLFNDPSADTSVKSEVLSAMLGTENEVTYELAQKLLGKELQKLGLHDSSLSIEDQISTYERRWNFENYFEKDLVASTVRDNLRVMYDIHARDSRALKIIQDTYGIYNFGRYPVSLLWSQYQARDTKFGQVALYVSGTYDNNYALTHPHLVQLSFDDAEKLGIRAIYTEVGSVDELVERLNGAYQQYGKEHITYIYIDAHANSSEVTFIQEQGKDMDAQSLTQSDLIDVFSDTVTVINACNTAQRQKFWEESFARKIYKQLRIKMLYAYSSRSDEELFPEKDEQGGLRFISSKLNRWSKIPPGVIIFGQ